MACAPVAVRLGLLWEPTANFSVLLKNDYNYLDLSGYPSDPVNSPNDRVQHHGQRGDAWRSIASAARC